MTTAKNSLYVPTTDELAFINTLAADETHPLSQSAFAFNQMLQLQEISTLPRIPSTRWDPVYVPGEVYNKNGAGNGPVVTVSAKPAAIIPQVKVYPNPSNSYFNIEVTSIEDAKVQLIDLRGTILQETKLTNGIGILAVDNITNGFYFIRLTNERDFVSVKKVTVIH